MTEKKKRGRKRIYANANERIKAFRERKKIKEEKDRDREIEETYEKNFPIKSVLPDKPQTVITPSLPVPISNPLCPLNDHCLENDYHCSLGYDWVKCKYYLEYTKTHYVKPKTVNGYSPSCFHSDEDNREINNREMRKKAWR